jgi:hypothetical protein
MKVNLASQPGLQAIFRAHTSIFNATSALINSAGKKTEVDERVYRLLFINF